MADVIDVENALVTLIAATLYPNGTGQPSAAGGIPCKVYAGWPTESQLDSDLRQSIAHVTVYPTPTERNTSRFPRVWETQNIPSAALTLTIAGQQITVGGAIPQPFAVENLALGVGSGSYVYQIQPADTLASIAAALAALVAADFPGSSAAGAVITLPTAAHIRYARVGVVGTVIKEVRRQERVFQITAWTDTPAHRDAVIGAFDPVLADIHWLTMPDGTKAKLLYKSSPVNDMLQKAKLYRRDLVYTVEYATTQVSSATQVVASQNNISNQPSGAMAPISTATINL